MVAISRTRVWPTREIYMLHYGCVWLRIRKLVIKNMKEIKNWVIEEILIFTLNVWFWVEKLRNSIFFFFWVTFVFWFLEEKWDNEKCSLRKFICIPLLDLKKKSNKIFLLKNYVWISISLTKKESIKTRKMRRKKTKTDEHK